MVKLYELQSSSIDQQLKKTANGVDQAGLPGSPPPQNATQAPADGSTEAPGGAPGPAPAGGGDPSTGDPMGMQDSQPQNPSDVQNTPDTGNEGMDDPAYMAQMSKKVDSFVASAVQNMPYVTDYRHDEKSKINPFAILQMNAPDLENLRNLVKNNIYLKMFTDNYGLFDNPEMRYWQDLLSYVERILDLRKRSTDRVDPEKQKRVKPKQMEPSKTKAGPFKMKAPK